MRKLIAIVKFQALRGVLARLELLITMPIRPTETESLAAVASLLRGMGASQVFVFGSFTKQAALRAGSDIDIAVCGLPPSAYFSAVSKASDLLGRPVDLVDLDDETPLIRYLRNSGELVRVG